MFDKLIDTFLAEGSLVIALSMAGALGIFAGMGFTLAAWAYGWHQAYGVGFHLAAEVYSMIGGLACLGVLLVMLARRIPLLLGITR